MISTTRIGPDHQLPRAVDDLLEVEAREGLIVLRPATSENMLGLSQQEQGNLDDLRRKIEAIRSDLAEAQGLSTDEVEVAVRAGLISEAERWWWVEQWLAGEREVEREIQKGRIREFTDPESFFEDLRG